MTTPAQLAKELADLAKAATPGRWGATPVVPGAQRSFYLVGNREANNREVDIGTIQGGYNTCAYNAALIVALVNNLPAIIDALRMVKADYADEFGPCVVCGQACEPFAANPYLWPSLAGHRKYAHLGCVGKAIAAMGVK